MTGKSEKGITRNRKYNCKTWNTEWKTKEIEDYIDVYTKQIKITWHYTSACQISIPY